MNDTVKSGGMEELKFGGASPCISGRGVGGELIFLCIANAICPECCWG